jgi:hypothetical protein
MNLLFGDGHVEWEIAPRAMQRIQENAARLKDGQK